MNEAIRLTEGIAKTRCGGFLFEHAVHPQSFCMPEHVDEMAHFVLVREGAIENTYRGSEAIASAGSMLFVPPNEAHVTHYRGRVRGLYVQLAVDRWNSFRSELGTMRVAARHPGDAFSRGTERLYREFCKADDLTPLMLESLALDLLVGLARESSHSPAVGIPRWLGRVRDLLHARYVESLSLESIAAEVGVHPAHLTRTFRAHFGCTVGDYVRNLRIEKACVRLADPRFDLPLGQLALDLGFADQSGFCRTFKQATGMTPREFRNAPRDARPRQNMSL